MNGRIVFANPVFLGNEKKYVNECLETGWISGLGRFINEFESRFADFCGVPYALSCTNGTAALHLVLQGLGVGPGDEVIVPVLTYVATANAVQYCGAKPVFVDAEPRTMNIDPRAIEKRITARTKGIIPVHLYGHPAEMRAINKIAAKHNLFVLEDASQAHGARYRGKRTGSLGTAATFSFFGNKILTTGEGGIITTADRDLYERMKLIRNHGMDPEKRYWFPVIGNNFRMTNIQAALGLAQLEQAELHLEKRRQLAEWYDRYLSPLSDWIELPKRESWAEHVFWLYTILLRENATISRDEFMAALQKDGGIETRPTFYPMHVLPPYAEPDRSYPVAESLAQRGVSLPTHGLLTEEDVAYIAEHVGKACCQKRVVSAGSA